MIQSLVLYAVVLSVIGIIVLLNFHDSDIRSLQEEVRELRDFKTATLTSKERWTLVESFWRVDQSGTYTAPDDRPVIEYKWRTHCKTMTIAEAKQRLIELSGKAYLANCNKIVKGKKNEVSQKARGD